MRLEIIDQFLFPYQRHFSATVRFNAEQVFKRIGADTKPSVFMVGVAWPALEGRHIVCVEPEDGLWPQQLFTATPETLDVAWSRHPMQQIFYGDEPRMRDKPENIRRLVVSDAVRQDLERPSRAQGLRSFVSTAQFVDGYYVTIVLQVPETLLAKFPPIPYRWMDKQAEGSFLLSCIRMLLSEAERALTRPEPGRFFDDWSRSAEEIVLQAARNFMRIPFLAGEMAYSDIFEEFNALSRLMYEGTKGRGRMILAKHDDPNLEYVIKLSKPVPLRETRWARKLLQMGSGDTAIITGLQSIYGLGRVSDISVPPYSVDFLDQQQWDFRRGDQILLRTRFGEPRLPQEPISEARFLDNFKRLFPDAGEQAAARFRIVLDLLLEQPRGCMLVVADDAESEAARLEHQGTRIKPTPLTRALIDRASRIDGTILTDPLVH